jgi:phosphoglucomutase
MILLDLMMNTVESKVEIMNYINIYKKWIDSEIINEESRKELLALQNNDAAIEERFYKNLEFGTGGLRGIIGAGTNRINVYTVRKATQGLANFINLSSSNKSKSVAIAYDSRHYSDVFAEETALVLAANDIKAYVFDSLRPTPELSFAVRHLNCDAGIVITASHNPPEYNGYKVYGSDGGQITLDMANAIISEIDKLDIFDDVKTCSKEAAINNSKFKYIGDDVDSNYLNKITELSINPDISRDVDDFKIVYTPIHGTGLMPITRALSMLGYNDVNIVLSQKDPNGDFPTVKSPNPEEREALSEGIKLAEGIEADIVLGTDPDADRVGVAVRNKKGNYELLTGNQIGALLTHYLVSNKKDINSRDAVIKTIVTSEFGAKIAKSYGVTVFNTLTGFKFIGEKIKEFEEHNDYNFLFGYEESYGYLAGTFVRDKDAVISSVLIVEMAAVYKSQGLSLLDAIDKIYQKYGYYSDALDSFTFKGIDGQDKIKSVVDKFRNLKELIKVFPDVNIVEDYKTQERYIIGIANSERIELPSSNVIKVHLADESWFAVRPSGTEPKLKIYYSSMAVSRCDSYSRMDEIINTIRNFIES